MTLGHVAASVAPPPGTVPVVFKPFTVTLRAEAAEAHNCFTASKVARDAYPVVDAAKVVDLGP